MKPPADEMELERYLKGVSKLRDAGDFAAALEACSVLINDERTKAAGLRARADVYADMRDRASEITDRQELVALGIEEPSDYFELGIALWRGDRLADAAEVFLRAIEIGEQQDFDYYTNTSRMHLAGVLLRLNRSAEAKAQCSKIPEGYSSYLPSDGMTSREQLLDRISRVR